MDYAGIQEGGDGIKVAGIQQDMGGRDLGVEEGIRGLAANGEWGVHRAGKTERNAL